MDSSQLAGSVAGSAQSPFWPGLSSIKQNFENYFAPSNAVQIGGSEPSIFSSAVSAAEKGILLLNPAAPVVDAATATVSAASNATNNAINAAESGLESAGQTVTSSIDKITSGLEWGLVAIGVILALWVIAQLSVLIPRRPS